MLGPGRRRATASASLQHLNLATTLQDDQTRFVERLGAWLTQRLLRVVTETGGPKDRLVGARTHEDTSGPAGVTIRQDHGPLVLTLPAPPPTLTPGGAISAVAPRIETSMPI